VPENKKNLRIALTTDCNLRCKYCCMKYPEILSTFKKGDFYTIARNWKKYNSISITGGEPFLDTIKLGCLLATLDFYNMRSYVVDRKPIYIYSNGLLITLKELHSLNTYHSLRGLNISWHSNHVSFEKLKAFNKIIPVRLHVQDIKVTLEIRTFCKENLIPLKIWTKDDCSTVEEDRILFSF
jgi:molybdenum cofactor biosynthesis enzyme MoaA